MGVLSDIITFGANWDQSRKRKKYGEQQLKEAEAMKPKPITYEIPSSVNEAVKMYQGLSREGLPGEDIIRDQMGAAYAGAASDIGRTAESGVGALGVMSGLYGKFMSSVRDLGVQSAQVQAQNEQNYIMQNAQAKMQLGDYQDRAWDINVNQPFQRGMNEYWATKQAGTQNLWGGIDQMTAGVVNFAGVGDRMQQQAMSFLPLMNSFGGGGQRTPSYTTPSFNPNILDPTKPLG